MIFQNEVTRLLKDILNRFCDTHGGGDREIEVVPNRFGGYTVTLAWDGISNMGWDARMRFVAQCLIDEIGPDVFQTVQRLRDLTLQEKIEKDAIAVAAPSELPWMISSKY